MRISITATLAVLILIASSLGPQASLQESRNDRDGFFPGLLVGGAEKGTVYVEVPLKARYFANAKTAKDSWAVWDAFFARVLREQPDTSPPGPAPYWGDFAYEKVDWASVANAVDLRVGNVLRVRTPTAEASVKVIRYAIHYNAAGGSNLLLAVAQPLANFKVIDTDFLVAALRLPSCGSRCAARAIAPDARTLEKIHAALRRGAKIPAGQQIKEMVALQGSFTRPAQQYVVYADFGSDSENNPIGYWRTVILDSDFSTITVVGENKYTHIKPRSVSDIDGDGLDEIWVGLHGYEGSHAGLIYWRRGAGNDAFRYIANAYNGA